jgi:hypothetical protein
MAPVKGSRWRCSPRCTARQLRPRHEGKRARAHQLLLKPQQQRAVVLAGGRRQRAWEGRQDGLRRAWLIVAAVQGAGQVLDVPPYAALPRRQLLRTARTQVDLAGWGGEPSNLAQ